LHEAQRLLSLCKFTEESDLDGVVNRILIKYGKHCYIFNKGNGIMIELFFLSLWLVLMAWVFAITAGTVFLIYLGWMFIKVELMENTHK
jgi:hypothetical protein